MQYKVLSARMLQRSRCCRTETGNPKQMKFYSIGCYLSSQKPNTRNNSILQYCEMNKLSVRMSAEKVFALMHYQQSYSFLIFTKGGGHLESNGHISLFDIKQFNMITVGTPSRLADIESVCVL